MPDQHRRYLTFKIIDKKQNTCVGLAEEISKILDFSFVNHQYTLAQLGE